MAGGGYYPIMSDTDWKRAPFNQPDPEYQTCDECNGDGGVWYDDNGNEFSKADYERMSDEMRNGLKFDECEHCGGKGEIEVEPYEPDWDDYD